MSQRSLIQISHLNYQTPDESVTFKDLSLAFYPGKYGLVGDNGSGKTTLLRLLAGEYTPESGQVITQAEVVFIPQRLDESLSIAAALGVESALLALQRVHAGECHQADFDCIGEQWDLEEKLYALLEALFGRKIDPHSSVSQLSGGQRTKLLFAKVRLTTADVILMDEPSNNLDLSTKQLFIDWLNQTDKCLIIASHDRQILKKMDHILETNPLGVDLYGGNYDLYLEQKALLQKSIQHQIEDAKKNIQKVAKSVQLTREKHEQRAKKGRALRKSGGSDKLTLNSMQGRSEKSQSRNLTQADAMKSTTETKLEKARERLIVDKPLVINLPHTHVPNGKTVLEIEGLSFSYDSTHQLFKNFNLNLTGPERIALRGDNGSGKSTLIQLILKKLTPLKGTIELGVEHVGYLDQHINCLQENLSLLDNLLACNPRLTHEQAHELLAKFKFRNDAANKVVFGLSGGERVRAGLAVQLCAKNPPQLLILDEPTNHLDIKSITLLEEALNCYQGALIIICHDPDFLQNIHVDREVKLGCHLGKM